jgi:membrane associated rhomboid family serine protease
MASSGEVTPRSTKLASRAASVVPVFVMVALMWISEIVDQLPGVNLDQYGIRPRDENGLVGLVTSPFLHGDFGHLMANTGAFLVLGCLIALTTRRYWAATIGIALVGGLGTWLVAAPNTVHIGASGLVYGYAAFLVAWGVLRRKLIDIVVAVVVVVMYGGIVVGLMPGQPGISWEGHLFGAIAGALTAWYLSRRE